jgi:hypothetical protein
MNWVRLVRGLILGAAILPLLAAGSCVVIAQTSVLNGFFNAVTPIFIDQVRVDLGLPATSLADTSGR